MRQPMLAATIRDTDLDKLHRMFPLAGSIKYDGYRAVGKDGEPRSRTMKLVPNRFVQRYFAENAKALDGLDMELMVDGSFQDTGSALTTHGGEPDFVCRVFDRWDTPSVPFGQRILTLSATIPRIEVVHQRILHNLDEFLAYEEEVLFMGHEGIMARRLDAPYKYGRSTLTEGYLMKRKPFDDTEGIVVGFEEAKTNTNEATRDERGYTKRSHAKAGKISKGTLGVLLVQHPEFDIVRIGGGPGWTQKLRDEIWLNQEKYLGKIVTFEYQRVGTKDKPRSGKFRGFRSLFDI